MIIGLPGNPTSTMVTFQVFARPVILTLMGCREPVPQPLMAITRDPLDNRGGRETYFRVRTAIEDGHLAVRLAGGQDSSMLLPLSNADALARVPADLVEVSPGSQVDVFPL
jgi:molybdopterin molybdotransferase